MQASRLESRTLRQLEPPDTKGIDRAVVLAHVAGSHGRRHSIMRPNQDEFLGIAATRGGLETTTE